MAGKKHENFSKLISPEKKYDINSAIDLIINNKVTKFDSTVNVVYKLNLNTTLADQQFRGAIALPHGTGKKIRILVLTDLPKQALEAGASFAGGKDIIEKIRTEKWTEFDLMISEPKFMPELGKIGQILGPKGLMPNPKTGTVTPNVIAVLNEFIKGKVKYKTDKDGNLHFVIGKTSFNKEQLLENFEAIHALVKKLRPSTVKGFYIKNISISSTMSPGIKVEITE